jgi:hypothetical protein
VLILLEGGFEGLGGVGEVLGFVDRFLHILLNEYDPN